MKQLLESNGWVMYHECYSCSGGIQFFKNTNYPNYEVRIKPKRNTASILLKNVIIAGPFWGYELEKRVSEINLS